ncbi:MAG: DUF2752 domain-containing protein [Microthrixaceae bacterium]
MRPQLDQTDQQDPTDSMSAEGLTEEALVPAPPQWGKPLIAGAAAACGCIAIALINPTDTGVPVCWSRAAFGVDCPLCGGLRATNDLMRGRLYQAADNNVFVAVALPVLAVVWVVWVAMAIAGRPFSIPKPPTWVIALLAVLAASFTVLRNTGGPAWVDWLASGTYR